LDTLEILSIVVAIFAITGITLLSIFTPIFLPIIKLIIKDVQVRRIYKSTDKDFEAFCLLFERRIRFDLREDPEDVGEWLDDFEHDKKNHHVSLYECLLVAKFKQKVIGFLFFEYSEKNGFLYIEFLGAKENEGDTNYREVTTRLVQECYKILKKEKKQCRLIVFEVDDENDQNLNEKQRQRAESKKRLFGRQVLKIKDVKKRGAKVYEICFDYFQPPVHRNRLKDIKQDLAIVPLDWVVISEDMTISKEQLGEILHFLFFEVYDTLSGDRYLGNEYHTTLTKHYNRLLDNAPDKIKLKLLTKLREGS